MPNGREYSSTLTYLVVSVVNFYLFSESIKDIAFTYVCMGLSACLITGWKLANYSCTWQFQSRNRYFAFWELFRLSHR